MLQSIADMGLTLNRAKCQFLQREVKFYIYIFSGEGITVDPAKVIDVKDPKTPQSPTEVRSFLGLATYCGRFIPT